jgi:hypothetical protein
MRRGLAVARKRRRLLLCIHEPNYQCGNFIGFGIEREIGNLEQLLDQRDSGGKNGDASCGPARIQLRINASRSALITSA